MSLNHGDVSYSCKGQQGYTMHTFAGVLADEICSEKESVFKAFKILGYIFGGSNSVILFLLPIKIGSRLQEKRIFFL